MSLFKGSAVAMITPFSENGVNYNALGKIIDHIVNGSDALLVLGTTGEPCTMTKKECEEVIRFTVAKVNKRIHVIAGAGGNNTAEVIESAVMCEKLGADSLLIVTPYYNKCTQNGLVAHFKAVSDAVNIPIIVYNVPSRTGLNIAPSTYVKLAEIKNVRAIKEAGGNIEQMSETLRLVGDKLAVYSGDDGMTVPSMALGAKGVISVAGNVMPKTIHELTELCFKGNFIDAAKLHFKLTPFIKALFCEVNPIPCKKAMQFVGFDAGIPRLPLTEMEPEHAQLLKSEMAKLGLCK